MAKMASVNVLPELQSDTQEELDALLPSVLAKEKPIAELMDKIKTLLGDNS